MTRKEAIKVLNMVEAHGLADEAKQMAIQALQAQADGDLVSRQAVLDGIEELKRSPWATDKRGNGFEYLITEALDVVADLCVKQEPSVKPQTDCNTCDKAVRNRVGVIGCAKFDSKPTVAQADGDLISRQAVIDAIKFEDKWLHDAKGHNKDTEIAFSGMYKAINNLPTWETTEAVIKRSGFYKFIAENINPNEYQWYYEQYYHTTDEKVGGRE